MEEVEGRNQTLIVEFILLGFGDVPHLQPFLFLLFLVICLVTVAGNLLIVLLIVTDQRLHTPMYFFLGNLYCLEILYCFTILPRLLASLLTGNRTVSVKGCIVQLYVFSLVSNTENLVLTVISYDRYVAICHPLRYATLLNSRVCSQLVAGAWISSFLVCNAVNIVLVHLTFCGSNEIDHFFCDFPPLINLSCSDTRGLQLLTFTVSSIAALVPFLLTLTSYVCIIAAILRIPTTTGRQKAFSTCSSHLLVVTVAYGTVVAVYVANTPRVFHKIFSVSYTILNPMINPVIYSLRSKEVHEALRKAVLTLAAVRHGTRI